MERTMDKGDLWKLILANTKRKCFRGEISGIQMLVEDIFGLVDQLKSLIDSYCHLSSGDDTFALPSFSDKPQLYSKSSLVQVPQELEFLFNSCPELEVGEGLKNEMLEAEDSADSAEFKRFVVDGKTYKYECFSCSKVFGQRKRLLSHSCEAVRPRALWSRAIINGEKRFLCSIKDCAVGADAEESNRLSWSKTTGVWQHFRDCHATESDLIFHCKECEEKFPTQTLLTCHVIRAHPIPLACYLCGKIFKEAKSLKSHERRHTGEKPYKCLQCSYSCVNKSMLNSHVKKHSKGDRKSKGHVCEVCGKVFRTRHLLGEHAHDSHGKACEVSKSYLCGFCGKTLQSNSGFRRHLVKVHGIKFTCEMCDKSFSKEQWMHIHRRDVHGIQI